MSEFEDYLRQRKLNMLSKKKEIVNAIVQQLRDLEAHCAIALSIVKIEALKCISVWLVKTYSQ